MSGAFFIVSTALFLQNEFLQKSEEQNFMQQQNAIVVASKKEEQQKQQQNLEFYRFLNSKNNDYKRAKIQDKYRIQQPLKTNKK